MLVVFKTVDFRGKLSRFKFKFHRFLAAWPCWDPCGMWGFVLLTSCQVCFFGSSQILAEDMRLLVQRQEMSLRPKQETELRVSSCCFLMTLRSHGGDAKSPLWIYTHSGLHDSRGTLSLGEITTFVISGMKKLLFVQGKMLPHPSRLLTANTALGNSPGQGRSGPWVLGTPTRSSGHARGLGWTASSQSGGHII